LVTRSGAVLRQGPASTTPLVERVPKSTVLDAIDMDKGWFKVRLRGGRHAYVENAQVDVPPRSIEADGVKTPLRSAPGGREVKRVVLRGTSLVLNMRYVPERGLWYELDVAGTRGWVPATLVRPRFSLPVVHFIAGLYRYQFRRYNDASREFSQYVSSPGVDADNPSLATAYQLLGASTLLSKPNAFQVSPADVAPFSKAIAATPYDPDAYALRALSSLAVRGEASPALADLEQALSLDPENRSASRITATVHKELVTPQGRSTLQRMLRDSDQLEIRRRLLALVNKYPRIHKAVP
jgi:hypothetical protein